MADELDSSAHSFRILSRFSTAKRWASASIVLFFIILLVASFIFTIDISEIRNKFVTSKARVIPNEFPVEFCNETIAKTGQGKVNYSLVLSDEVCPHYFQWIHEDLLHWKSSGISRNTLEKARELVNFRLVILNGTVYIEKYRGAFQTRDLFTIWGILQLPKFYPGRVPDLELMFGCGDESLIRKRYVQRLDAMSSPVFQYSANHSALALIFPDWSFWGWAEVNIKPWERMAEGIINKSKRIEWKKRAPYAYWKGNPYVSANRMHLMECNVSGNQDWNARLYSQDWAKEIEQEFKNSNLEDQCKHRYKIYVEGRSWSVSGKYIIACDSMTLLMEPEYHDFFMRSMMPMQHYWPITSKNTCEDIKFAVDWGNKHPLKAEAIGKEGSKFIKENLKMEYVYAYMFHLLNEYAKLLKFKPKIPQGATLVCPESMLWSQNGIRKKFMEDSIVISPSSKLPCHMPPYDPSALKSFSENKENITRQVMMLEKEYWENINKTH